MPALQNDLPKVLRPLIHRSTSPYVDPIEWARATTNPTPYDFWYWEPELYTLEDGEPPE